MNEQYVRNVVEAALLAAGRPLTVEELATLFGASDIPHDDAVRQALSELSAEYETRGVEIREVATGFRIQIRSNVSEPVSKLWQERPAKYSRALLETLALVAYRQPITRGEIEQIRGVAVNPNIIKTLLERSWIADIGCLDCKKPLIDKVVEEISGISKRAQEFEENPELVRGIIAEGCEKARTAARETMDAVREAMALNYR